MPNRSLTVIAFASSVFFLASCSTGEPDSATETVTATTTVSQSVNP